LTNHDPRQIAFQVLWRVEQGAYSDLTLDGELRARPQLDPRDRGLATELVYGLLRHRGAIDFALDRGCGGPLERAEPKVRLLLRLGAYQLLRLDRVPEAAAVNSTVELARALGFDRAAGFINGVLRNLARRRAALSWPDPDRAPRDYLISTGSLPAWLAERWFAELGPAEAVELSRAMLEPAPLTLRANTLRTDRDALLEKLRAEGYAAAPTRFAPEGVVIDRRGPLSLLGATAGWFQVQDEASMLVPHLLQPRPGDRILDACAAPGGKTTHLAALTGNGARITALDLHSRRLRLLEKGAEALGCQGIETCTWDLSTPPTGLPSASFDRVLLDAPCSGLGVLRRNPEIRWRRTADDIDRLARLQGALLEHVAPLVRPGGHLLYSVCTVAGEETDHVARAFTAAHPEFDAEDLRPFFPEGWHELFDSQGRLRTWPHRQGMDGFFALRWRRRNE